MTGGALHEEHHGGVGSRLRIAVIVVVAAAVPLALALYTAREALRPLTEENDVLPVFSLTFLSIVFEALPFVLLGAVLSGLIETFVSPQAMLRMVPRSRLGQLALGAAVGVVLPVCECGVIVVVRRLLRKGVPLRMALAYLLAAPIVNPVVIVSTFAAFRGKPEWLFLPVARVTVGVLLAMAVAAWAGRGRATDLARVDEADGDPPAAGRALTLRQKLSATSDHAVAEFLSVLPFLIAGALAAAVVQTVVPRTAVNTVADRPVLAVAGMMALAVGLNLCSEADAFVASGFLSFGVAARLAFLVLGPMFDLKLLAMYGAVFRRRLVQRLVAAVLVGVFVIASVLALAEAAWFGGPTP